MADSLIPAQVKDAIDGKYHITWIRSFEEVRVITELVGEYVGIRKKKEPGNDGEVQQYVKEKPNFYIWSVSGGLVKANGMIRWSYMNPNAGKDSKLPKSINDVLEKFSEEKEAEESFIIMRDFHEQLKNPVTARKIRDLIPLFYSCNCRMIIVSPIVHIPQELQKEIKVVDYGLPSRPLVERTAIELLGMFDKMIKPGNEWEKIRDKETVVNALSGMTTFESLSSMYQSLEKDGKLNPSIINQEKKSIISKCEILEYWDETAEIKDVGGMDLLKTELEEVGNAMGKDCMDWQNKTGYKVDNYRGVLLVGIPGAGKSLISKAASKMWDVPLIRLDCSKIFGSYIGMSESNVRSALETVDAVQSAVLWVDEIEKGFGGVSSSNKLDAGTSARVFGVFLHWMQEKKNNVVVIATCNDMTQLPAELLRQGRFDSLFFVDLPGHEERKEIFKIHLEKVGADPSKFNLDELADIKYIGKNKKQFDYTGAEIEGGIKAAVRHIWTRDKAKAKLTVNDIKNAMLERIPLSCSKEESIEETRKMVKDGIVRPASKHGAMIIENSGEGMFAHT